MLRARRECFDTPPPALARCPSGALRLPVPPTELAGGRQRGRNRRMGFDQYHEPPDELPAATRTFARLCASLTEEAEAIGWYEQRHRRRDRPRGPGDHGQRAGRGVQALLHGPRVPAATHAPLARGRRRRSCSSTATSSSTAKRPRKRRSRAPRSGARPGRRHIARHRQAERSRVMNHLLREHAPITEASWTLIDDEARERLTHALAARKLVDFAGPHGWEHSATNLGRTTALARAGRRARGRPAPRAAGGRAARAVRARARRAARRRPRRRRRRPGAARRRRASPGDGGEPRRLPRLARRGHHGHRRGLVAPRDGARRGLLAVPEPRREGGRVDAARRRRRPVRARARSRRLHPGAGDRARRLPAARPPAQDHRRTARLGARRAGRGRPEPARRRLPVRLRRGPVGRLRPPRRRHRRPLSAWRASRSASPRPRRPSRSPPDAAFSARRAQAKRISGSATPSKRTRPSTATGRQACGR